MKKFIGAFFLLALIACGGDTDAEVNSGETSSVVADGEVSTSGNTSEYGEVISDPVNPLGSTGIEYIESSHNFGNVTYPSENLYTFKFKNTGDEPLVIESAQASCGCTIPNKPDEPIMPGEIGEMDVIFRPKEGQQGQIVKKKVTVTANTEPKQTYLEISANVLAPMMN
jgi:hypothetical protein